MTLKARFYFKTCLKVENNFIRRNKTVCPLLGSNINILLLVPIHIETMLLIILCIKIKNSL